ncbi:MAG: TRAP transporter substrate-binding protein DctP [Gemmatimonadota bacterium]
MIGAIRFSVACIAAVLLALPAAAEEITLRAVAFIPKTHPLMAQTQVWVNDINAALKGKLHINYVGGPEVIPGLQQADAVGKGVIDIAFNPTAYYQSTFPEGGALLLSRKSVTEEREPGGLYDFMVKRHERLNLRYIGRALWSPFYLWTTTKVTSIDGLKGQKMRTSALYDRFMKALDIVPVTIPEGDTYTALEGGTVTGFGWPMAGPRERGWIKTAKYLIDLPFFASNNIVIIMNLDKWKALPEDVRKEIERVTAAFEPKMVQHYQQAEAAEWALLEKAGVQKIRFSDAENKRYIDTAYKVEWDNLATKVPDLVGELRKLTGN